MGNDRYHTHTHTHPFRGVVGTLTGQGCFGDKPTHFYVTLQLKRSLFFFSLDLSPLCSSLFALYDETNRMWFPPNHVFLIDETTRLRLHYRMRYVDTFTVGMFT